MKINILVLAIGALLLSSCNDPQRKEQTSELKCDYFDYGGSTFIITNDSINEHAIIYKYEKNSDFKKLIDSSAVKVLREKYSKEKEYTIDNEALSTNYDYRLL